MESGQRTSVIRNRQRPLARAIRLIAIVLMAVFHCTVGTAGQGGKTCPLDKVIFKDKKSVREFVALKVGLNQVHKCGDLWVSPYHHPQKRPQETCGPILGDKAIVGLLNGAPVVAVYTVIRGVPCCSWHSYRRLADAPLSSKLEWLKQNEMPMVQLGSEGDSISDDPDRPDRGPLGRGDFVPAKCRAGQ